MRSIKLEYPRIYHDAIEYIDRGKDILIRTCVNELYVFEVINEVMYLLARDLYNVTEDEIHKEFLRQIKYRMVLDKIVQAELANICRVSQTTISRYLSGVIVPDVLTASKIAKAVDCSLDELIFESSKYFDIE